MNVKELIFFYICLSFVFIFFVAFAVNCIGTLHKKIDNKNKRGGDIGL